MRVSSRSTSCCAGLDESPARDGDIRNTTKNAKPATQANNTTQAR